MESGNERIKQEKEAGRCIRGDNDKETRRREEGRKNIRADVKKVEHKLL